MCDFADKSTRRLACLFVAALTAASVADLRAQVREDALDRIDAGLYVNHNINRETLHRYWSVTPGVTAYLRLPFYRGQLHLEVQGNRYLARAAEQTDFTGAFILMGWGKKMELTPRLIISGSAHTGLYQMVFDDVQGPMKWEGEIAFGVRSQIETPVGGRWRAGISATYLSVRTARPVDLAFLSFGVTYRLKTPAWLLDFLE